MKQNHKSTYELLLEKHGEKYVPLTSVSGMLGINDEQHLRVLAYKNKLGGIRPFKLRDIRDSPFLVDLENVADELDKRSIAARS